MTVLKDQIILFTLNLIFAVCIVLYVVFELLDGNRISVFFVVIAIISVVTTAYRAYLLKKFVKPNGN